MPQNKKGTANLGQAMIRNRFATKGKSKDQWIAPADAAERALHKEALLKSSTAPSDLDEFLATATLAGTEFESERFNIKLVAPNPRVGVMSVAQEKATKKLQDEYKHVLSVPRRPHWDASTTPQELDEKERKAFLEWRKQLSEVAEVETLVVTPYEKNLEVWRQLWRVLERSDVVVQIVDARNPLLYYCEDLSRYVQEISPSKQNFILVNKADLLSEKQRQHWAAYFQQAGWQTAFFSALLATDPSPDSTAQSEIVEEIEGIEDSATEEMDSDESESVQDSSDDGDDSYDGTTTEETTSPGVIAEPVLRAETDHPMNVESVSEDSHCPTSCQVLSRQELVDLFKTMHGEKPRVLENVTTIGFVGYPNVGKSSTLNALMQYKRVSVSATPGKTKHFQTMYVDKDLLLCDCPGLVMPSFAMSSAEMTVSGILPLDQMRDYIPPINLICSRLSRRILENIYGIELPFLKEYGVEYHVIPPPTAEEFLNAYASHRGFVTARGLPDTAKSARQILKDYVNVDYFNCEDKMEDPEVVEADEVHNEEMSDNAIVHPVAGTRTSKIDNEFFADIRPVAYEKRGGMAGVRRILPDASQGAAPGKRHFKKNKKEKLRRIFRDLDVH